MKSPRFWIQKQALPFYDVYDWICALHPRVHAVSWELLTAICFEETSFCNVRQGGGGPGTGFGQVQIHNADDKPAFFKWMLNKGKVSSTDPVSIRNKVLGDKVFSLEIVCLYAQFKVDEQGKGKEGFMNAYSASHPKQKEFKKKWPAGEAGIAKYVNAGDRAALINALNSAKLDGHAIPLKDYPEYWNFTLPESALAFGSRY